MVEWIGQTVGKVRIDRYLAHGGMAEVYLGTHLTLDRSVAVKLMHSYIEADPELLARFQREARAIAGLRHPNIVQIYDFDTHDKHPYIVMEYLKGPSLAAYLRNLHQSGKKLSLDQVAHLLRSLASGLDYAHSKSIVHRDIKPANIILHTKNGEIDLSTPLPKDVEPIITDFGLVRMTNAATQTESGLVSGTPAYMSPEQASGLPADHRSDIYSLGIVLYEMLAGKLPFDGDSTLGILLKHLTEPPPPIQDSTPEILAVIDKALAKEAGQRYQSARDLLVDFYHALGMHSEAETIHSLRVRTPFPVTQTKAPPPRRNNLLWAGAGIFICACIGFVLTGALGISAITLFPRARTQPTETQLAVVSPDATMLPHGAIPQTGGNAMGVLRFQGDLNQVTISAGLPDLTEGTQYEAWLVSDSGEAVKSLGLLAKNTSGQFTLTFIDPQNRNLLDGFNRMEITVETDPDTSPNPSDTIAYSSGIPRGSLEHIRHLVVSFMDTPNQIGMTKGLVNTTALVEQSAESLQEAFDSGDRKSVRAQAEAIINLIAGNQSYDYKDWNQDGQIEDPGDGFGLLLNGDQVGYVEGTIEHAELSADSPEATSGVVEHTEHVTTSARNVEGWATQLRDVAMRIAQSAEPASEADIRLIVSLAKQAYEGIDIDGNEVVDPIAGEGGATTAFEHAVYMCDMQILAGADQMPAAANP